MRASEKTARMALALPASSPLELSTLLTGQA
jgi:hypothetical protein